MEDSVFVQSVLKLQVLRLEWSKLTRDQTSALLTGMVDNTSMVELVLVGNHVDHVAPGVIGRVVGKLKKVTLENNWMPREVFREIFEHAVESETLGKMKIGGDNFGGDFSLVSPEVLGTVIRRVRSVRLKELTLSQDQCMHAIMAAKKSPIFIDLKMIKINIT